MNLSDPMLQALNDHWAIAAIGADELARVNASVNERLAHRAVGRQITFSFAQDADDNLLLERAALAYELAAIEGLDELSRPTGADSSLRQRTVAASYAAFEIRRLLPLPTDALDRIYFVLQISATAYCGDRWTDLRRWFSDEQTDTSTPTVAEVSWDRRLLYRLFNCWIRLFRKNGWDDLDRIREIIARLRVDQGAYEDELLDRASPASRQIAFRLVALYNWAKATETLATYMLQGEPPDPFGTFDKHFDSAIKAAVASSDAQLEMAVRWLHAAARIMVTNSLWWAARAVNSRVSQFVRSLTQRDHQAMFELLPPQRAALLEQGLLDQAKTAIVIDMPTSGGKTLLAQFRILQALNQFQSEGGWVVYVVPTRALSAQICRRLRRDFEPIGVRVEQLTGAIEIDAFEEELLTDAQAPFDILVATPEKLSLLVRNRKVDRPLALVVMDEAHNLEEKSRGLRIELLLATVKRDCPQTNFLLLMPFVEEPEAIARWLAHDVNAGHAISLGTSPWKPNERIVGLFSAVPDDSVRAGWRLVFETLTATERAMPLHGIHRIGDVRPIDVPKSQVLQSGRQTGLGLQTAAISAAMSGRGTSIAVANNIQTVWKMAQKAASTLPEMDVLPDDIQLVQDFLRTEISSDFTLIDLLEKGVGVHHAGLSDDVRALMEWLAESGTLRMLCATSTIAQGIDFPVSSVFLQSRRVPQPGHSVEMAPREFWNLAGRAGRLGHDSIGVVGLCQGPDGDKALEFVSRSTGALVSRLVVLLNELAADEGIDQLSECIWQEQWDDFRCYVAHLWAEKKNLDAVLTDADQLLRHTYGYTSLRNDPAQRDKADALLSATQSYAQKLANMPAGTAELADSTGFSPEGVQRAMRELSTLETKLKPADWTADSLFNGGGRIADLFGIMLKVPQLNKALEEVAGQGTTHTRISEITSDWVNGHSIHDIARTYFQRDSEDTNTRALTDACKAIYRTITNNATWGISALSRVSGIDFDTLSDTEKRSINMLPAMIYHGVRTEDAVLMRMNSAPRTISERLGALYRDTVSPSDNNYSVSQARDFLTHLRDSGWESVRPTGVPLSGSGYRRVWEVLSGETRAAPGSPRS